MESQKSLLAKTNSDIMKTKEFTFCKFLVVSEYVSCVCMLLGMFGWPSLFVFGKSLCI